MVCNGLSGAIHYIDDFLFVATSHQAARVKLSIALKTCHELEFPVATDKTEGPATSLVFLGIQFDTRAGALELPQRKVDQLRCLLREWEGKRAPIKRDLLSLLGHLSHAASVIRPGRTFVRHLIDAASQTRALHHHVRLNAQCRADLQWWTIFGLHWSGRAIWPATGTASVVCVSDASGSWGCGAFLPNQSVPPWFHLAWPDHWLEEHIAAKEMVPVVIASALWGRSWSHQRVEFRSDNSQVVAAIQSGSSRHKTLAHLARCLFFIAAAYQFTPSACHILGHLNAAADAISRNQSAKFLRLTPSAALVNSSIPAPLQDWVLDPNGCWTSQVWRERFVLFMGRD